MSYRRLVRCCAFVFFYLLILVGGCAWAEDYPSHAIQILVPYPAGGTTDIQARFLAKSMEKTLGQPVIVSNQPGVGGAIAAIAMKKAKADGYTICYHSSGDLFSQPFYMEQGLFIAISAGLGGMLGWGLADFFAKKTIDEIGDVATLAWAHIFGTGTLLIIVLYQLLTHQQFIHVPSDVPTWAELLFFGVLQAIVYLLVYRGFGKGQVALLSPIFASFSVSAKLESVR